MRVSRAPEVIEAKNSQTMALLEGHRTSETIKTVNPHLAIVDENALSAEGDISQSFVDLGSSNGQISVYIVRKGDNLATIAKMFGVSSNTIIWANDLKGNKVVEGQELVILPISGVKHTVKKGDTLQSIATKYKADLDDILAFNDVTIESKLVPGEVVIVPDGEITAVAPTKPSSSSYSGYYIRPFAGGRKTQGIHGHNGVDIAGPMGTPIVASAAGKVIISRSGGYNGGYGTYVVISHANGTQTLYSHMDTTRVVSGQAVVQGQAIGTLGNTGKSTGAHLHFEIRGAKNPF